MPNWIQVKKNNFVQVQVPTNMPPAVDTNCFSQEQKRAYNIVTSHSENQSNTTSFTHCKWC